MDSEQTISLMQIMGILRKHLKMISITTLVVFMVAFFATFFVMTPKYSGTTEILVNRKLSSTDQSAQLQQVQADVQMISTYKDIITSPTVLTDVNRALEVYPGYPGSMAGIKDALSINNQTNSQVFSVTATATDPKTAAAIANETAKVFKQKVVKMMSINNVSIVSKATPNYNAVSPRKALNLLIGLVAGVLLGIVLAFLREVTDRTVTTESFLTNELGLNSLGVISEIDASDVKKQIGHHQTKFVSDGHGGIRAQKRERV
ncbi:MAG: Wzz/FepE/Etk N-terminal domain-containing protein [Levilactobacillus sp.]|jgi:capsular polysaccharide biosynthesis protein|uniref:YveK family protein n=1 Tax=Levilactobacillus sp. TaxID=2767919 RepID=UPI002586BA91|nr:Wzz/FepE/Etk N-terminal domain-containing protein [Levilactobacillus sp.]MCH4123821.1 Wzz/FepE/Etk N-terminal domain-containing protein [Levilactobacillus sp.]MCI1553919.1 Wzz/FepE/Etk N-terminal domain-containing protein [Levilactobacillus sp.]